MSYISLYRKYRPMNFSDLIGQEFISSTLKSAVQKGKTSHAYLFSGPKGTGKTSTAKIFAKLINCKTPSNNDACNECENCKLINAGEVPDIIEIDAASNNGVEEARELIQKVSFAPSFLDKKIYIIDEVHMLTTGAFNSLLKTIEEPPAHIVFILATTESHKIPGTIISRCQRYDFTKLTIENLEEILNRVVQKENISITKDAINQISYLADGAARDAISILDQVVSYSNGEITLDLINKIYGILNKKEKIFLLNKIAENDLREIINTIKNLSRQGIDINKLTYELAMILKDKLLIDSTDDVTLQSSLTEEEYKQLKFSSNNIIPIVNIFVEALSKYKTSDNVQFVFELACLEAAKLFTKTETQKENIKKTIEIVKDEIEESEKQTITPEVIVQKEEIIEEVKTPEVIVEEEIVVEEAQPEVIIEEPKVKSESLGLIKEKTTILNPFDHSEIKEGSYSKPTKNELNLDKYRNLSSKIVDPFVDMKMKETRKRKDAEKVSVQQQSLFDDAPIAPVKKVEPPKPSLTGGLSEIQAKMSGKKPVEKKEDKDTNNNSTQEIDFLVPTSILFNIMSQQNTIIKEKVKSKIEDASIYVGDNRRGKFAGLLVDAQVVAACEHGIIVVLPLTHQAKQLNEQSKTKGFLEFLNFLIGDYNFLYSISREQWKQTQIEYTNLRQLNRLPATKKIDIKTIVDLLTEDEEDKISTSTRKFSEDLIN